MDHFDTAIRRLTEVSARVRSATADKQEIGHSLRALRDGAIEIVEIMRRLVEEMKEHASP